MYFDRPHSRYYVNLCLCVWGGDTRICPWAAHGATELRVSARIALPRMAVGFVNVVSCGRDQHLGTG